MSTESQYVLVRTNHLIEDINNTIRDVTGKTEAAHKHAEVNLVSKTVIVEGKQKIQYAITLTGIDQGHLLVERKYDIPKTQKEFSRMDANLKRQLWIRILFSAAAIESINTILFGRTKAKKNAEISDN